MRPVAALAIAMACALLGVSFFAHHVEAIRDKAEFEAIPGEYIAFATFGFKSGGTASLTGTLVGSSAARVGNFSALIFACTSSQCGKVPDHPCNADLDDFVTFLARLTAEEPTKEVSWNITSGDFYTFAAVDCSSNRLDLEIKYHFVNPGGEELSTGQIPFKPASRAFSLVWTVVFFAWALRSTFARSLYRPIHGLLIYFAGVNALKSVAINVYWTRLSQSGEKNFALLLLRCVLSACSVTYLFAIMLALSAGWCVTQRRMPPRLVKPIHLLLVLQFSVYLSWTLFEGVLILFFLVITYGLIMRMVFMNNKISMVRVLVQMHTFQDVTTADGRLASTVLNRQFKFLRNFRTAVTSYIAVEVVVYLWILVVLQRSPWLMYLVEEIVMALFVLYLWIPLRPRRDHLFFYAEQFAIPLLGSSSPIVELPAPVPVVVIQNPDTVDATGKSVPSFMVGTPAYQPTVCGPPASWATEPPHRMAPSLSSQAQTATPPSHSPNPARGFVTVALDPATPPAAVHDGGGSGPSVRHSADGMQAASRMDAPATGATGAGGGSGGASGTSRSAFTADDLRSGPMRSGRPTATRDVGGQAPRHDDETVGLLSQVDGADSESD